MNSIKKAAGDHQVPNRLVSRQGLGAMMSYSRLSSVCHVVRTGVRAAQPAMQGSVDRVADPLTAVINAWLCSFWQPTKHD